MSPERVTLGILAVLAGCGPPPALNRSPEADEIEQLVALVDLPAPGPWSASGHARIDSSEGRFEGVVNAILEPPGRLRAELHSRALFGMVGERVVVSLPGDGHVLFFQERQDRLERRRLADSELGRFLPTGAPLELHAILSGRPPWPGGKVPEDLVASTRVLRSKDRGRSLEVEVAVEGLSSHLELHTDEGRLVRVAWSLPGGGRVEIRYERWKRWDGMDLPTRIRLDVASERLQCEIDLDAAERRKGFSDRDFEVY